MIWDRVIYPRGAKSRKTIDAYIEALEIGAQFPPIKIQRVFNYIDADGNEITEASLIIDGIHRWSVFAEENTDKAITTYDYNKLLSSAGWKMTHRIECPLSSERMSGNMVKKMQDRRILGTTMRTLHIAKKHEPCLNLKS